MTVRQLIPQGLAEMAPGPELSALLAKIDVHALTGADVVEVLRARARQLSHDQARLLAVMVKVGLCDPDAGVGEVVRLSASSPYAADEIRAALAWTRNAVDRELSFAETLVGRMPAMFTALESGRICRSNAWVFADLCADLTGEQIAVVCARLLPKATRLTPGELAARIKKLAIALDPGWAARRYATAVRERTVIGYLNPDGTATVTGSALPVDEAAVACAHVEELARATKRAGHLGRIGPLRADIYLGLLDGRWQHCTRDQIITDLLTHATSETDNLDDPTDPDGLIDSTAPVDPVDPTDPDDSVDCVDLDDSGDAGYPSDLPVSGDVVVGGGPVGEPGTVSEGAVSEGAAAQRSAVAEGLAVSVRRVGVEVRVGLSTLLGRDRHPGEVAGWGAVTAEVARTLVAAQRGAEWRYALTDSAGQLVLAGITRHRPHPTPETTDRGVPPCRGGIVELHLPATLLTDLATDLKSCGPWAAVVADLAAHYTRYTGSGWVDRPVRTDCPVRRSGIAPPCPDPGPGMCLPGLPRHGPQRRPRPHHRPRLRRGHHRGQLRTALQA